MKKPDFEQMTNRELAELYKNSREEYVKERDKQQARQGENALVLGDQNYWEDERGYIHEGEKPQPRTSTGFDEEMLVPEWRDRDRTPAQKLADFANANLSDPEIASLLPEQTHVVIARYRDYEISGRFDDGEWHIVAVDTVGNGPDIRFRMDGGFDQDEAAAHARNGVKNELAIRPRELTETDINFVRRIAPTNRELAVAHFLKSRLPAKFERELNQLAAEIEATGSSLELLKFMSHPDINDIASEAVSEVWRWAQPHLKFTSELEEFLQDRTAGSVLSFVLLDRLLKEFHVGRQLAMTTASVTEANLNELPDEQVADLYNRTRVEFARSRR
jgi:hypothetical protein